MLVLAAIATASPVAAATGGVVSGTVTGGGQPLAAVCATLIGGGEDTFHFDATETATDGTYRFTAVPPGAYSLSFEDCDASPVYAPSDVVVEVEDGDDVDLDVALERGAFVAGRVADVGGTGLPSICVQAVDPTVAEGLFFLPVAGRTSRDGTFRVGPLPVGPTVLRFEDCGVRPTYVAEWWQDTADMETATVVQLEAGLTASGFDVALARGARVVGGVADGEGAPVPGACIVATDEAGDLVAGAETDSNGAYELGGLPAGSYRVAAARCTSISLRAALLDPVEVEVALEEDAVVDAEVAPAGFSHLAGVDRIATAAAVARATTTGPGLSGTAVLARADEPADALAAVPLAASLDAPLLLTERSRLSAATADALDDLGVAEVVVVGGFGAITASVESQLRARDIATRRLSGSDRYGTAAAVAGELGVDSAWIVSGTSWADALAVGPLASSGAPILLTAADHLPAATREALGGVDAVTIVGGTGVVGASVAEELGAFVPYVARVAGRDRYDTAARLLRLADAAVDETWVASGTSWSDALAAGAAAARVGAPLVLVDPGDLDRSPGTAAHLRDRAGAVADLVVVGAVGDAVVAELAALVPTTCAESERC